MQHFPPRCALCFPEPFLLLFFRGSLFWIHWSNLHILQVLKHFQFCQANSSITKWVSSNVVLGKYFSWKLFIWLAVPLFCSLICLHLCCSELNWSCRYQSLSQFFEIWESCARAEFFVPNWIKIKAFNPISWAFFVSSKSRYSIFSEFCLSVGNQINGGNFSAFIFIDAVDLSGGLVICVRSLSDI